jgi:hypothetical protein
LLFSHADLLIRARMNSSIELFKIRKSFRFDRGFNEKSTAVINPFLIILRT